MSPNIAHETRTQQFKRILATTGKVVTGNLILLTCVSAGSLLLAVLGKASYEETVNFMVINGIIWVGGMNGLAAACRLNPKHALLYGAEMYDIFVKDGVPAIKRAGKSGFNAMKNKVAQLRNRNNIKVK